jgi:glycosyltransferase involved in cell wall biosynthesis
MDTFASIIVPIRNAGERTEAIILELDSVVRSMFRSYEIILVDDASTDDTVARITDLQRSVSGLQLYCLNRVVGFDVSTVAGLDNCIGDFIFILNQETDPISMLPALWTSAQEGNEVVCGVRRDLRSGSLRAWMSRVYFRIFRYATGLTVPSGISTLRLYSRKVVSYITQNNDRNSMVKVLPFFSSYHIGTVDYTSLGKRNAFAEQSTMSAVLAGITILLGSSSRPLRLFTAMSLCSSLISLLYCLYVIVVTLFNRHVVQGWISLAFPLALMSFFLSTLLGIVAEYVFMLVQQSGNRPAYTIVAESTSSVLEIRRKLNVVGGSGDFADHAEELPQAMSSAVLAANQEPLS